MKRTAYFIRVISLFAAVLLMACGCAANGAINDDTAVAIVENTKITYKDYVDAFNEYYNALTQNYELAPDFDMGAFRTYILNELVDQEMLYQKALEANPVLTQEEQEYVSGYTETLKQELLTAYEQVAQQENAADVSARALELLNAELKDSGYENLDAYLAQMQEGVSRYTLVEAFKRDFAKDITVSEADMRAKYEENLEEQTKAFDETPADFETAQNTYDVNGGFPPVYVPTDYIRVKHILVDDFDTANDLVAQINAGSDFDELMAQYGKDPGMQREPTMSYGYLVCESTGFVQSFKDAAFALQNVGDISAPTESMHGYHIIRLEKVLKAGAIPFEEVKDAYMAQMLTDARNEALADAIAKWRSEANIQRFTTVIGNVTATAAQQ